MMPVIPHVIVHRRRRRRGRLSRRVRVVIAICVVTITLGTIYIVDHFAASPEPTDGAAPPAAAAAR